MARSRDLVWTPSADVLWDGEVTDAFRSVVAEVVGRSLDDDEWEQLCRVIRAYSFQLNHEHQAQPLPLQQEALRDAAKKAAAFMAALEALDQQQMGTAFHSLVADEWERQTGRVAEFERMEARARTSMSETLSLNGIDPATSEDLTSALFADWYASGFLINPELASDFMVQMREVQQALSLTSRSENISVRGGSAFDELVGRLFEWGHECRLPLSATKASEFNNHGKMTYLVKAILGLVPELKDDHGQKALKQMREPTVADASLAHRILASRKRYNAGRPD